MRTLWKMTIFLMIALLFSTYSCNDDNDENSAKALWGTWVQIEEHNFYWIWKFSSDGGFYSEKYYYGKLDGTEKGTYTCTKDTEGGTIILSPWPDMEYQIISITGNEMELKYNDNSLYFTKQ